jgi:uncharacterized protein (UPF0218 family)
MLQLLCMPFVRCAVLLLLLLYGVPSVGGALASVSSGWKVSPKSRWYLSV